jgi:hypothetical protein
MPGLVPGIHVFLSSLWKTDVDGRDKPGHDGSWYYLASIASACAMLRLGDLCYAPSPIHVEFAECRRERFSLKIF